MEQVSSNLDVVRWVLSEHGYYAKTGSDFYEFAARLRHSGRFLNPQFAPNLVSNLDEGRWTAIYRGDGSLAATIALRVLNGDFVQLLETGHVFYDNPSEHGWGTYSTGVGADISIRGRICSRGGIHSFEPKTRMAWWTICFALAHALELECDYSAGTAWPETWERNAIQRFYGYQNMRRLPSRPMPFADNVVKYFVLLWSRREDTLNELISRATFLKTPQGENLGAIVDAFQSTHIPQKHAAVG